MIKPNLKLADFIFVEQRGVGFSRPRLDCPGTYDLRLDEPGDPQKYLEAHREYLSKAVSFWEDQGVDIRGYNVRQMAADIDDLRRALGYDQITLLGGSFGSHHGLAMLRYYDQFIDKAILWSVEGPNHTIKLPSNIQAQLEQLNGLVKGDSALHKRIPDLLEVMAVVLDRLDRTPISVKTFHPQSGEEVSVTLGKYDLQLATADGLGRTRFLQELPARYMTMASGDYTWLAEQAIRRRVGQKSNLMYEATDFASGATAERREQIFREAPETLLGDAINEPFHQLGDVLGDTDLGDEFRGRLVTEVSTLLVSGTLDARTPLSNAEDLLTGLAQGQLFIIEGVSHDLAAGDHIDELVLHRDRFLRGKPLKNKYICAPFAFSPPEEITD